MIAVENGMVVGAEQYMEERARIRDRIETLVEEKLEELNADDGSVEEAIGQNADLILEAVRALRVHKDADAFLIAFDKAIDSHLEPAARQWAGREIYVERGLA
jgi:hypothetical protein